GGGMVHEILVFSFSKARLASMKKRKNSGPKIGRFGHISTTCWSMCVIHAVGHKMRPPLSFIRATNRGSIRWRQKVNRRKRKPSFGLFVQLFVFLNPQIYKAFDVD